MSEDHELEKFQTPLEDAEERAKRAEYEVDVLEFELAMERACAWRVPPNTHTVSCELNNYEEPDPFEGPGETWRAAYERVQRELMEARQQLTWYRERVVWVHLEEGTPCFFQGPKGEHEISEPVDVEYVLHLFQRAYSDKTLSK